MLKGASRVLVRDSSKFLKEVFLFCLWFITGKLCKQRLIQITIRSTNTMLPLHKWNWGRNHHFHTDSFLTHSRNVFFSLTQTEPSQLITEWCRCCPAELLPGSLAWGQCDKSEAAPIGNLRSEMMQQTSKAWCLDFPLLKLEIAGLVLNWADSCSPPLRVSKP